MASISFFSYSILHCRISMSKNTRGFVPSRPLYFSKSTSLSISTVVEPVVRRSTNYEPSIWSFDHIQSLSSTFNEANQAARAYTLKAEIKTMMRKVESPWSSLELVDDLQRFGISYHNDEIGDVLKMIYNNYYKTPHTCSKIDLNLKAIGFHLLRQHDYLVSQDIFRNFKDEIQNLTPHENMKRMLNLYEASYHSFENESILDDARDFTTKCLTENLDKINDVSISSLVIHALELPLHWRVPRVEAKWFIELYKKRNGMNPTILELAKLDFNMVQSIHLEDLKHASRWWRNTSWDTKLSFARDRVVENFLWTIGFDYLPHSSILRRMLAKVFTIIVVVDDVYDVYGTLKELEKFTEFVNRWDINAIEELPDYMKICFFGFYNAINEIAYNTLTKTGSLILPYLLKEWVDLCKSFLVEARWYNSGYTPTLEEYLDNACVSIAGPLTLIHTIFSAFAGRSTEEILRYFASAESVVRYSSLILRLANDLATSSDEISRGSVPKSVQCYMNDTGATEDESRMYIKELISKTWKKLNEERAGVNSRFPTEFCDTATNMARMAQFMYKDGDRQGCPELTKSHVLSLLFNPIQ